MRRAVLASAVIASVLAGLAAPSAVRASPAPPATNGPATTVPGPLPVVYESATVNPNNPIGPGSLLGICVTSKTLGWHPKCSGA